MNQDQEHRQTVERLNGDNSMNDYCPAGSMKSEMKKREKGRKKRLGKVEIKTLKIYR